MVDFIIAVAAVLLVAWTVIKKLKRPKSSCNNRCLYGFDCELCEKKVR